MFKRTFFHWFLLAFFPAASWFFTAQFFGLINEVYIIVSVVWALLAIVFAAICQNTYLKRPNGLVGAVLGALFFVGTASLSHSVQVLDLREELPRVYDAFVFTTPENVYQLPALKLEGHVLVDSIKADQLITYTVTYEWSAWTLAQDLTRNSADGGINRYEQVVQNALEGVLFAGDADLDHMAKVMCRDILAANPFVYTCPELLLHMTT